MLLLPSIRALYCAAQPDVLRARRDFLQASCMMNSPAHRLRRRNADLPRRLRRIIMTMPTAMPLAERQILQQQAEAARDLAYLSLGLAKVDYDEIGTAKLTLRPDMRLPDVILNGTRRAPPRRSIYIGRWRCRTSGDARAFFDVMRLPLNAHDPATSDGLRIATLDVGGGTTDLVDHDLPGRGAGANVTLFPRAGVPRGIQPCGRRRRVRGGPRTGAPADPAGAGGGGLGRPRGVPAATGCLAATVATCMWSSRFAASSSPLRSRRRSRSGCSTGTSPTIRRRPFRRRCGRSPASSRATPRPTKRWWTISTRKPSGPGRAVSIWPRRSSLWIGAEIDRVVRSIFLEMLQALGGGGVAIPRRCPSAVRRPSRMPAVRDISGNRLPAAAPDRAAASVSRRPVVSVPRFPGDHLRSEDHGVGRRDDLSAGRRSAPELQFPVRRAEARLDRPVLRQAGPKQPSARG